MTLISTVTFTIRCFKSVKTNVIIFGFNSCPRYFRRALTELVLRTVLFPLMDSFSLFLLNFDNCLETFCSRLFEPAKQNIGTVEGENVKLTISPFTLMGISPCFGYPAQTSEGAQKDVKIEL